jgi:hypothetical protein
LEKSIESTNIDNIYIWKLYNKLFEEAWVESFKFKDLNLEMQAKLNLTKNFLKLLESTLD